jgi:ABC-type nickel/cobalt efflux system permease component RcnA
MGDTASLQNLRDIVEPPPVPWWPPAAGWWILLAVLAAGAIWLLFRVWRQWRSNAYRRAALKELRSATDLPEVAEILKRTALCAFPRTDIASLSGKAWTDWLSQTSGQDMPVPVAASLADGVFDGTHAKNPADVASFVESWIRHHRRAHC